MIFDIPGDGQYLALIDAARYVGFVREDWTLKQLQAHAVRQMAQLNALVWSTGFEADWRVQWRAGITDEPGYHEISGTRRCCGGTLHLAHFDSLTMAAQFADHVLPDADCIALTLTPGLYQVRIGQRVSPSAYFSTPACDAPPASSRIPDRVRPDRGSPARMATRGMGCA